MSGKINRFGVVDVLRQTQVVLDRDGWIQGKLHSSPEDKVQGRCLVGALHTAAKDINTWYQNTEVALLALSNALTDQIGHHSGVGQWNDYKTTTRAHVDSLLSTAIERYISNG